MEVRWTAELHPHLAPAAASFVAPAEDGRVRLLGPEPGLGAVGACARGIARDLVPEEDAFLPRKMPGLANDPRGGGRPGIIALESADFVRVRLAHVPDAEV